VPPNDSDGLTTALQRTIAEPELRRELARNAHERASQFSPERMLRQYRDCYTEALVMT
jgi:glycosyltransferase involved in cell wall biosynthesis